MSTKQSPAIQLLIQRYEGISTRRNKFSAQRRMEQQEPLDETDASVVHMSGEREEKTITLPFGVPAPVEEPLYASVQKQESVVMRDKSKTSFRGQRSSLVKSRTMKNISFSFPPLNAIYNFTVSVQN